MYLHDRLLYVRRPPIPIVELEVFITGNHTMQQCYDVKVQVLKTLFYELCKFKIDLEAMFLKPSMVMAGTESA